ncbi:MAG: hypothetical protein IJ001_02160 [Oscillospiraceae bacterium]|nr:hypothetical protein [Oscillospiraceae bacterium]
MSAKHSWTFEEDGLCCDAFFKVYVIQKSNMPLSDFVRLLSLKLPAIKAGSLRLKVQNIKQLALEYGIENSLKAAASTNYSKQNQSAFVSVMKQYAVE